MRGKFLFSSILFFLFLTCLGFAGNFPVEASSDDAVINEIMPYPADGEDEWLEIYNKNDDEAFDLTGMWLMVTKGSEPDYDYQERIDLSGTVPRQGFLTFNFSEDDYQLPNDGACISIFIGETTSIHSLKYGNGTCDAGTDAVDATEGGTIETEQGKSINAKMTWEPDTTPPNATFVLTDPNDSDNPPSRGWCDISDEQCFQISALTSQLTLLGVTTNLDQQEDLSRATSVYFDNTNYGRISFANEINFTDRDAMTWLGQLQTNMTISQGVITLDADLIQNLISTQATLTMKNITLSNPSIQVTDTDGSAGDSTIVSGLSYDQVAHTLTFTAAHFTTFTAVETSSSSSSSSSSSPSAPHCADSKPATSPDLFQINTSPTFASLFFTPISNTSDFFISFSENPNAEEHGEQVTLIREGVQSHLVYHLKPNTTYYFKVRGQNGCMPGDWSNILKTKTNSQTYYRYYSPKTTSSIAPVSAVSAPKPTPTASKIEETSPPDPVPTKSTETTPDSPVLDKKCFLWWCW